MNGVSGTAASSFIWLLIIVGAAGTVARVLRSPHTIALVLTGAAVALVPGVPRASLTPGVVLALCLPVLLFQRAYTLDHAHWRANLAPIALLAMCGALVTAGLTGLALHLAAGVAWGTALLFGTIISATEPLAMRAIFDRMRWSRRLATVADAESLLNNGVGLVLFATALGVVAAGSLDLGPTLERLAITISGSLALGVAVAILGAAVLRTVGDVLPQTLITFTIAYGGYLLADRLGISGALETIVAGVVLGARRGRTTAPAAEPQVRATWEFADFLVTSLLFLLMGLALHPIIDAARLHSGGAPWWPLVVALGAIIIGRAAACRVVGLLLRRMDRPLPQAWPSTLTWAGGRGAVAAAAALSLPSSLPDRQLLLTLTFGVMLTTLAAHGLIVRPAMLRLEPPGAKASPHDLELR